MAFWEFFSSTSVFSSLYFSTIAFYTHLHLRLSVLRRTNGRRLGPSTKVLLFHISVCIRLKCISFYFCFRKIIIEFYFSRKLRAAVPSVRYEPQSLYLSQPYIKVSGDGCMTWHATAYTGPLVQKWNIAMPWCIRRKTPTPGRKSLIFFVINDVVIHHA